MKTLVVGFGHKCRSGKDTAVQAIIDVYKGKLDVRRYAFADALKAEVAGREKELCEEYSIPYEPDNKHRRLLQFWGTKRREEDPDYWVKQVEKKIGEESPSYALISDLRFPNEFNFVKTHGFTVHVDRLNFPREGEQHKHISETALDPYVNLYDYQIQTDERNNNRLSYPGTLYDANNQAVRVFSSILEVHN